MTRPRHDPERGDVVLGWLTKVTLVLAVLGVCCFDAISLVSARFQAADAATAAAHAAARSYQGQHDLQRAFDAAWAEVAERGDTVETDDFTVAPDGAVTLTVSRTASTLVLEKVEPLRRFTRTSATATGRPAS